jgi:hypothetical protein
MASYGGFSWEFIGFQWDFREFIVIQWDINGINWRFNGILMGCLPSGNQLHGLLENQSFIKVVSQL